MTGIFMVTGGGGCGAIENDNQDKHLSPVNFVLTALRKSMLVSTCRQDQEVIAPVHRMKIGWPTDVQHITHVTFDRFHGFLGLPVESDLQIPCQPPTASVSVGGVSANSVQWSYDTRSDSVPTILLLMQERLYALGGLKAEGIFRINPENSKEEDVKDQMINKGLVPEIIDVHCLAGLIKAWFRELPSGVLDGLSPEQVLQCNSEDDFVELIKQLKPTESRLLGWAINLMADVAEEEETNKMNARNIAMVFAPNMTQMWDPLTALMHAVQVTNLLKTLILKELRDRDESAHFTSTPENKKYYNQHESDASYESIGRPSDDDDNEEDRDEIDSLTSEPEDRFLKPPLASYEISNDGFRKQLERILCSKDNASPSNNIGSAFYADSGVSFSGSRVGSSCISTSDDEDSRLSSIASRSKDRCQKRTQHGSRESRDQYLLSNNVFSQYSHV